MRILFQTTATTFLRHFTDVVLQLADRGHEVRVAQSDQRTDLPPPMALKDHKRISFTYSPGRRGDAWAERAPEIRAIRDYLRYLDEPFKDAVKLRSRAMRKAVKAMTDDTHRHLVARCPHCAQKIVDEALVQMLLAEYPAGRAALMRRLALIEDTIPSDRAIDEFLRAEQPDVVLITPLIRVGSYQADYVKSAKALGIPVGFPVFSWDNLSTKGLVHVMPDRMFVWNERQRQEAVDLHQVPGEHVVVTGAPRFDRFFAMTPQVSRAQFCERHRLDVARPIISYLCSSEFVAENERDFVVRWIDELHQSRDLESCNIVIRPHPRQKGQWKGFAIDRPRVAVAFPESISTDQSLYDTMHHSAAVVGLNTSAELEAGIVGRPVFTIVAPEFTGGQPGTLHFHYLLKEHGGFVELAHDFEAHRCQLAAAVAGRYDAGAIETFIDGFLRPHGRNRAVSPMMADAIEELARTRQPRAMRWWSAVRSRRTAPQVPEVRTGPAAAVESPRAEATIRKAERKEEKKRKRMARMQRREQRTDDNRSPLADPALETVVLDYAPHEVRLVVSSVMERKWRAHACEKEPWTVAWLEESLRDGGVLYDIGANVGAFSLIAAKLTAPTGTVVAFEPGYASFARLCDNIVLNGCQAVVLPLPLALGSQTGMGTLRYKSLHAGQSRHHFKETGWVRMNAEDSNRYYQPVLAMTLDDAVKQFNLALPQHVKLDVDGRELNVLRGAAETLRAPGLRSILVEIDDGLTDEVVALLTQSGFVLDQKFKRIHEEDTQVWYGVFRRRA